ncbi:glycosyltransferase family 2 protein [Terrabacter sp. 2YAF2]|uniref:glycosyltransferase family 2 protein n=1 Tax=Terrabacter sp. 2YAF2 TaxID=3233026 RepID=UPI003F9ACEFD
MSRVSVSVVMPAFNESAGIAEFLGEIEAQMTAYDVSFVVVDDLSSDDTSAAVEAWAGLHRDVQVIRNAHNLGHGISTLTALHGGLRSGADVVVAIDGDGQFFGRDVAALVATLLERESDLAEGSRVRRDDPLFRRATSTATRVLVRSRCGVAPRDANTPLRAYRPEILRQLLDTLPPNTMTPNLMIASTARKSGFRIVEIDVESRPRRGPETSGSTWNARRRSMPSRRFMAFCRDATIQWFAADPAPGRSPVPAEKGVPQSLMHSFPSHGSRQTTAAVDA